jgi:hypothetical protein
VIRSEISSTQDASDQPEKAFDATPVTPDKSCDAAAVTQNRHVKKAKLLAEHRKNAETASAAGLKVGRPGTNRRFFFFFFSWTTQRGTRRDGKGLLAGP